MKPNRSKRRVSEFTSEGSVHAPPGAIPLRDAALQNRNVMGQHVDVDPYAFIEDPVDHRVREVIALLLCAGDHAPEALIKIKKIGR